MLVVSIFVIPNEYFKKTLYEFMDEYNQLTADSLHTRGWWRFAQVVYVLAAVMMVLTTGTVSIAVATTSDYTDKNQSTIFCSAGGSTGLRSFLSGTATHLDSVNDNTHKFSSSDADAKAKIFCVSLNREDDLVAPGNTITSEKRAEIEIALAQYRASKTTGTPEERAMVIANYAIGEGGFSYASDISSRTTSKSGEDMNYSIQVIKNYNMIAIIIGAAIAALLLEAGLMFIVRGVARYTLVGKFF